LKIPPKMNRILHKVYGSPASITLVSGDWKTGKTDFAILITEMVEHLGLINKFASNIETSNSHIDYVHDFSHFDAWLYSNRQRKMYLYDEIVESSPRRSAMSGLNVGWVRRIPQLSKGKCHLIAITQEVKLGDSIFVNPIFLRGHWRKINKKNVIFFSRSFNRNIRFRNIPACQTIFDPYRIAHFSIEDSSIFSEMLPLPLKVLTLYGQGLSLLKIQKELQIEHPQQVKRELIKGCKTVSSQFNNTIRKGIEPEISVTDDS
jgi:hypothetical protein